jgi:uncharacterized membrane protein YcaP (DUF421 family)
MNISLCPYKFIFGKPKEGVHQYRIFDIALADVLSTIAGAYLISKFTNQDFKLVLFILFLLGIILHHLFCVQTTIDKFLFRS